MKTKIKNADPAKFLQGKLAEPIILLYFHINHLKQLYRNGWLRKGRDISKLHCESVADHIFGMSILALLICDLYFPKLDCLKVLKMCLTHELGEIIHGDQKSPRGKIARQSKYIAERCAVIHLLKDFPTGTEYLKLWEEFEEGKSPEASLVKQLDKLEMALQAKIYSLQHKKNLQEFIDDVRTQLESGELKKILDQIEVL